MRTRETETERVKKIREGVDSKGWTRRGRGFVKKNDGENVMMRRGTRIFKMFYTWKFIVFYCFSFLDWKRICMEYY